MSPREILTLVLIGAGCAFYCAGTVGLLRFPDTHCRLHALTKADNVGLGLICLGLAIHDGTFSGCVLLVFVWLLAMTAGTISAFLIARWQPLDDGPDHV